MPTSIIDSGSLPRVRKDTRYLTIKMPQSPKVTYRGIFSRL